MKSDFKTTLKKEAAKIDIILDSTALDRFEMYKNMLIEWNEKINLTAITDEYGIIMKHFIDCLEITKYIDKNKKIIDVGTGAGFPGIVIAIYFDNIDITLLDSLNKRLIFLEDVVSRLNLKNVKIVHARAEEFAHKEEYRQNYDIVVSRAVAPLNILLEYDIGYLKIGGKALFLKGDNVDLEISNSKNSFNILNCKLNNIYDYTYNFNDELFTRKVLEIIKKNNTPSKYPRNYGKIKKNPL